MAGMGPAPLPHIGLNLGLNDYTLAADTLYYSTTFQSASMSYTGGGIANPAPLPHLSLVLGSYSTRTLAGDTLSYALTVKDQGLKSGRKLVADALAYTLTLVDQTLTKSSMASVQYPAPLPMFSLLLTGVLGVYNLPAQTLSYALSIKDATLRTGYSMTGETVTYTVNVAPAERDIELNGDALSYSVAMQDALLIQSHPPLTASPVSYTWTIRDAALRYEQPGVYVLPALTLEYALSIVDANLRPTPRLYADTISFEVTVNDAGPYFRKDKGGFPLKTQFRRKYVITIDGQDFLVNSPEEAAQLLEAAEETAKEVVAEIPAKPLAPPKIPRIRVSGPPGPELTAIVEEVAEVRDEIKELYEQAIRNAEIAYYLRLQDDEEALEALLID